jgi:hypothetical protein
MKGQLGFPVWMAFKSSIQTLEKLADSVTPLDVYAEAVEMWARQLDCESLLHEEELKLRELFIKVINAGIISWIGWDTFHDFRSAFKTALIRLSRFLRYDDRKSAELVFDASMRMEVKDLTCLIYELNKNGINDGWAILLMFSPNLMQNLLKNSSKSDKILSERLKIGMHCLAYLFKMAREHIELKLKVVVLPQTTLLGFNSSYPSIRSVKQALATAAIATTKKKKTQTVIARRIKSENHKPMEFMKWAAFRLRPGPKAQMSWKR